MSLTIARSDVGFALPPGHVERVEALTASTWLWRDRRHWPCVPGGWRICNRRAIWEVAGHRPPARYYCAVHMPETPNSPSA